MKRVFLGGTCSDSTWREQLIAQLRIDYYNPLVEEWNDEAVERELYEREHCDFCLYVITPRLEGYYSIAEVVDDSNKRPAKTIFCFLESDGDSQFNSWQLKSLRAVGELVRRNGAQWCHTLREIADLLNNTA